MIPANVDDKLQYFDEKKYYTADGDICLKEESKQGKAKIECKVSNTTLVFHNPEENTFPYLDNQKANATKCSDCFVFELVDDQKWILHIMEYKKTINTNKMQQSRIQLTMGLYNARAIIGFLNLNVTEIRLYTAYRNDDISRQAATIRAANTDPNVLKLVKEWIGNEYNLVIDCEKTSFIHKKIQLNEDGEGSCEL